MTCDYPAPCCCCCPCCEDIPPFLAVTLQGVEDTERCDECGWFNNTFLLTLNPEDDESLCPRWSCRVEPWPCEWGHAVTISVWLTNPPAELGGGNDECGLEIVIDDSSGESVMYTKLIGALPADCYHMILDCRGDCVDYEDINKCCFNAAVITIEGQGSSS